MKPLRPYRVPNPSVIAARLAGARRAASEHRWLLALLALAVLPRVAAAVAYPPALFYGGDSSQYLKLAFTGDPVAVAFERPSGYPLLIDIVTASGRDLTVLVGVQHLAGLATGTLTYLLLLRLSAPRWLALAGSALVLLDSYAIALEQHVLAESFFSLAVVASAYLAVGHDRGPAALGASGLLLGLAATLRTAALFAIPAWLAYTIWAHRGVRPLTATALGIALPLLAYSAWHERETGHFGLTQASGWFLYARIGEIGDCRDAAVPRGARALCNRVPRDTREGAAYHLFDPNGTAHRAFGSLTRPPERQQRVNRLLREFALAIIRDRPLEYAGMVGADFLRYFRPAQRSRYISDLAITFPDSAELPLLDPRVRRRFYPELEPTVRPPAAVLRSYQAVVHVPRWLLAPLALAGVLVLLASAFQRARRRLPRRREVLLLVGGSLCLLLGATATSEFVLRYLVPVLPLLISGGIAACLDLLPLRSKPR